MSQPFTRAMARPLVAAALFGALALPGAAAFAANTSTSTSPSGTGGKKVPTKVTFINAPSSETPAAREKRLRRECKGRPNAGACLGYTR